VIVKLSANQHFYNTTHPATDADINLELLRTIAKGFSSEETDAIVAN